MTLEIDKNYTDKFCWNKYKHTRHKYFPDSLQKSPVEPYYNITNNTNMSK